MKSAEESNREINQLERKLDHTAQTAEERVEEAWQAGCNYQRNLDLQTVEAARGTPDSTDNTWDQAWTVACDEIAARIKGEGVATPPQSKDREPVLDQDIATLIEEAIMAPGIKMAEYVGRLCVALEAENKARKRAESCIKAQEQSESDPED